MKKSMKRQQKKARRKMAIKMDKLAKLNQADKNDRQGAAAEVNEDDDQDSLSEKEDEVKAEKPKVLGRFVRKHQLLEQAQEEQKNQPR